MRLRSRRVAALCSQSICVWPRLARELGPRSRRTDMPNTGDRSRVTSLTPSRLLHAEILQASLGSLNDKGDRISPDGCWITGGAVARFVQRVGRTAFLNRVCAQRGAAPGNCVIGYAGDCIGKSPEP